MIAADAPAADNTVRFNDHDELVFNDTLNKWIRAELGWEYDFAEVDFREPKKIYYDGKWIEQTLDGRFCRDGQVVWLCETNYAMYDEEND